MTLALYPDPMSACGQKVVIALYKNETSFDLKERLSQKLRITSIL
jgi:hypothetical protein